MKEIDKINRRKTLKALGLVPLAGGLTIAGCNTKEKAEGHEHNHGAANDTSTKPEAVKEFFTDHERKTVKELANIIIPKDDRSGSASEAGVPEFIEFMMTDQEWRQTPIRGGLAWLDRQCVKRFEKVFIEASEDQKKEILNEIAWPANAKPAMTQGVAFFNHFRDLTATGFWTSEIGIKDLQYMGNVPVAEWKGCTDEACKKLGVSYGQ